MSAAAGLHSRALTRLSAGLQRLVDANRIPGAVAMIYRNGEVGYLEALGRQDPQRGTPMRPDAIFRIHSMTKPIVSVAALMLVEEGRLQLSDPVALHLPAFANMRVGVEDANGEFELAASQRPMTVYDLLRHTAGLTYEFLPPTPVRRAYAAARLGARERDNATQIAALASLPLMCEPGSAWEYSRATDVLARVIEVVADEPLDVFLQETIFEPLGMQDTSFALAAARRARVAEPFSFDPDTGAPTTLFDARAQPVLHDGGGGLLSTAVDYARFLQMLLDGGRAGEARLLGRKTVEAMTSDHLLYLPRAIPLLPPDHGFGLGVAVKTAVGGGVEPGSIGSYGWSGSAGTAFFVDPVENMFAILMTQAPGQFDETRELFRQLVYAALDD